MGAYSGALIRSAHFAFRPPVPGIDPGHAAQHETGDIFNPVPVTPEQQTGTVWRDVEITDPTEMVARGFSHWSSAPGLPLPSDLHPAIANKAETARIIENHLVCDYRPDGWSQQPYRNAGQGVAIGWVDGRAPVQEGENIDPTLQYLVAGKNSFDYTNQPNEVYSGGRRRLGTNITRFGVYEFWTKQGQDADLRAYTGLNPAFPVDKPTIADAAPYTPNSSGTTTWVQPTWQDPSTFTLPSETSVSDFTTAAWGDQVAGGFDDGGRL